MARSIRHSREALPFKTKFTLDTFLVDGDALADPGDVFILLHENDEGRLELVWEPAKVVSSRRIPGETASTMYLLRYNQAHAKNAVSDIDHAVNKIQALTAIDLHMREPGAKAVELSDEQATELIAEFWG